MRPSRAASLVVAAVAMVACARPSQFERYLAAHQWSDAALEFASDTSLRHDEQALYRAGILFSTPGRPTYDPSRARELLSTLISQFPATHYHEDASTRLLLLDEIVRAQRDSARAERNLQAQIDSLVRETKALRAHADSATSVTDSLRTAIAHMDVERRDREAQLAALRRELQRLKEIDLKPPSTTKP